MIIAPDCELVSGICPSPNFGPRRAGARPSILLLHYTGVDRSDQALRWLARPDSQVSCHYVVDEDGRIMQMVAESMRAWHAGVACWAGEHDINSASIGIEIHNPGHAAGYPDFPDDQMTAVEALARDVVQRHGIRPERVLAHSDVAPGRKIDPGEKFDWARLARAGIGHWIAPASLSEEDHGGDAEDEAAAVLELQLLLQGYGYALTPSGLLDAPTRAVIAAFQRHFRPARVDGRLDVSTLLTLRRLVAALPASADGTRPA